MIVNVNYKSKDGRFGGRAYSYFCDIPDAREGDVVMAPTARGESEAVIVETHVAESRVAEHVLPLLKTIIRRKEDTHAE